MEYEYKAPRLSLSVGQFAKVRALVKTWENFPCEIQGKENQKESRLAVRILDGAEIGCLKTIRTRDDDLIFKTYDMAGKTDVKDLEFWIQKIQRLNSKGSEYTMLVASRDKPK